MTLHVDPPRLAAVADVRVVAVEAIPVRLPLARPIGFASGTITTADNVLVRVHSDAGVIGSAEAQARPYTYGETQASIVAAVRDWYAPRLAGADPLALERARARCAGLPGNLCARAAVEVALTDLAGQLLGVSCATLLGGATETVGVASMLSFGGPDEMAEEALSLAERFGVNTFKIKVGRDPHLDTAAVRAVRDALPAATFYVDANRGWRLDQARFAGDALTELGVTAIEEPLDLADQAGRLELARRWSVPLAGDESCLTTADVARELSANTVRQISIKVARSAFHSSQRILAQCEAHGVTPVVGSQYEGALGAWASIAFAAGFTDVAERPAEVANFLDLKSDLVARPSIVDGRVAVPAGAGLGVELDTEALAHFRLDA